MTNRQIIDAYNATKPHMEAQVTEKQYFSWVRPDEESPEDDGMGHWVDYPVLDPRDGKWYGARLSAPGYLDCTEWSVFVTREEAEEYLVETYDLWEAIHPYDTGTDDDASELPLRRFPSSFGAL